MTEYCVVCKEEVGNTFDVYWFYCETEKGARRLATVWECKGRRTARVEKVECRA